MHQMELRPLSVDDGRDVYDFLQSLPAEENGFMNGAAGLSYDEYRLWLVKQADSARKTEIEDGWRVPQGIYWLYVDGKPVGMAKLRAFLTDKLRERGGHLGYAIAPAVRGHGYAAVMVNLIKPITAKRGIDRMLITINSDNVPSIRTALNCGGVIVRVSEDHHYIEIPCK